MIKEKYVSFGGAGDAYIVALKILQHHKREDGFCDWLHVESHDISKMFHDICLATVKRHDFLYGEFCKFNFECNSNYIQDIKNGKYNDREYVSTSVDGWSEDLSKFTLTLDNPFINCEATDFFSKEKKYDIAIQVASGASNNNRRWKYNPMLLAQLLRNKGYKVCLLGNAEIYANKDDKDNFVNKITLKETFKKILSSKLLLSTSGLLTYFAVTSRVPTVYMQESEHHNKRYIHPLCREFAHSIEFGSIQEIKKELQKFGYNL